MACLALTVQPVNGPDLLLQTREYFPPARAAAASQGFKITRAALAADRRGPVEAVNETLGDDALAASSGQVVVGKESRYRVVYRLVNSVYVLGITSADPDDLSNNVFDCTNTVNQAVSVLVAACRGVDVTIDKLLRKYAEVYLALTVVLRGISSTRLSDLLQSVASGEGTFAPRSTEAENRARGAFSWTHARQGPVERLGCMDVLSKASFELPEEVLASGDEVASQLGHPPTPAPQLAVAPVQSTTPENVDPFAASAQIANPGDLAVGFVKPKDAPSDPMAGLAELTVPQPGAGGDDFDENAFGDDADGGFGGGLLGVDDGFGDDAFGGGLDASEFGATPDDGGAVTPGSDSLANMLAAPSGPMGALAELTAAGVVVGAAGAAAGTPGTTIDVANSRLPLMWIKEEIHAEFKGLALYRVGLQGTLFMKPTPSGLTTKADTEFSFRLDGAAGLQRSVINRNLASSLGDGLFHVRAPPSEDACILLKYRLRPRFTPLPLRVRLLTKRMEGSISALVQFVANPFLPGTITNVTFILQFNNILLQSAEMAPRGTLHKVEKQLQWSIPCIEPGAKPQTFKAKIPVNDGPVWTMATMEDNLEEEDAEDEDKKKKKKEEEKKLRDVKVDLQVKFASTGMSLSGMVVRPATESVPTFLLHVNECGYQAGKYICT